MLKDKIFQMFIIGTGKNLDYALKNGVGGVIFFTPDIESSNQFKNLVLNIRNKSKITPFLSIDQEGGRVERAENIHERFMSPMYALKKGEEFLSSQTVTMLDELKEYGINMNFAPCMDVNSNPNNPIIGERAFSDKVDDVCKGFDIVYPIYKQKKIISVIKHFPGHGDADKDSHLELPIIDLNEKDVENVHIYPFKYAIDNGVEAVMVAHLFSTFFEKEELPTSLSENCIDYLKNKLSFNGVIISDDMYMKGVSKYGMTEACIMGIKAGLNMFIYRDASDETLNVIEDVIKYAEKDSCLREKIDESYKKIIDLKKKYGLIS